MISPGVLDVRLRHTYVIVNGRLEDFHIRHQSCAPTTFGSSVPAYTLHMDLKNHARFEMVEVASEFEFNHQTILKMQRFIKDVEALYLGVDM